MVANNTELLTDFDELDSCADRYMRKKLQNKRYKFGDNDLASSYALRLFTIEDQLTFCSIVQIDEPDTHEPHLSGSPEILSEPEKYNELSIASPLRPTEFRSFTTVPMLIIFLSLMILLAALQTKSKAHGMLSCLFRL
jgi:hypothetical protein